MPVCVHPGAGDDRALDSPPTRVSSPYATSAAAGIAAAASETAPGSSMFRRRFNPRRLAIAPIIRPACVSPRGSRHSGRPPGLAPHQAGVGAYNWLDLATRRHAMEPLRPPRQLPPLARALFAYPGPHQRPDMTAGLYPPLLQFIQGEVSATARKPEDSLSSANSNLLAARAAGQRAPDETPTDETPYQKPRAHPRAKRKLSAARRSVAFCG